MRHDRPLSTGLMEKITEHKIKMEHEELTGCPMPKGTEGVVKYGNKHFWCKFSLPQVYCRFIKQWVVHPYTYEEVVIDLRKEKINEKPHNSPENSGLSCNYYVVDIKQPTSVGKPYTAECNDIIEALGMNATEANIFKEIWRTAAARTLGKEKEGHNAKRGAEKVAFFGLRFALQNNVSMNDLTKTLQDMKVDV